jgi:hypothetical protein
MITLKRGALRGTQLQNGALCLESWQVSVDHHIVLAMRDHSYDPYVVWDSTADGNCSRGDYCQTIQEAIQRAERRAGL